jgi:hypothetical protein
MGDDLDELFELAFVLERVCCGCCVGVVFCATTAAAAATTDSERVALVPHA